jgi:hypothetical protein
VIGGALQTCRIQTTIAIRHIGEIKKDDNNKELPLRWDRQKSA